jgi:hypothetical protein
VPRGRQTIRSAASQTSPSLSFLKSCYSGGFLTERAVRPGSPARLIIAYLLLMFVCHAAQPVINSIRKGKGVAMTKLQKTKSVFATVVKNASDSVGAVGAEVAAAFSLL